MGRKRERVWKQTIDSEERIAWEAAQRALGWVPVTVWTDGSCPENGTKPGEAAMGAAAILVSGAHRREHARPCGLGTNQQAELEAIKLALEKIRDRPRSSVRLYCDNKYAIGCMTAEWRLKKNVELVVATRKLVEECGAIEFLHVDGHSGVEGNELCDTLARHACDTGEVVATVVCAEPEPLTVPAAEVAA